MTRPGVQQTMKAPEEDVDTVKHYHAVTQVKPHLRGTGTWTCYMNDVSVVKLQQFTPQEEAAAAATSSIICTLMQSVNMKPELLTSLKTPHQPPPLHHHRLHHIYDLHMMMTGRPIFLCRLGTARHPIMHLPCQRVGGACRFWPEASTQEKPTYPCALVVTALYEAEEP